MTDYTPSLDEFHDGFEYYDIAEQGNKNFEVKLDILNTKVRYLDEDDITSLGFSFEFEEKNTKKFYKQIEDITSLDYVQLYFYKLNGEPYVALYDSKNEFIFSDLNVKNKHELAWLLTRYGVV